MEAARNAPVDRATLIARIALSVTRNMAKRASNYLNNRLASRNGTSETQRFASIADAAGVLHSRAGGAAHDTSVRMTA
jgi:hypothetical protein